VSDAGREAQRRVWATLPGGLREVLAERLPRTDLQTLLISLAADRAADVTPADVVRRWREDRFVQPARSDPRAIAAVESLLWRMLPDDVAGVELSPVVPLGTASALGPVSQNRVVSTTRLTEVVSDSTNALAVEAAVRRQRQESLDEVHLAAAHRQLRAQQFGAGAASHFRLFALVSSARDSGSGTTEARVLVRHIAYWRDVLAALVPASAPAIHLATFADGPVGERLRDTVVPAVTPQAGVVAIVEDQARERGRGYYSNVALRITADDAGGDPVDLGDGGLTTWTAQLMGNAKERCLVSCIATERLVELRG
jgi:hypothetical protein